MNEVTVARLARLRRDALRRRAREITQENEEKGLVKTTVLIHSDDKKSLRDYASWMRQRRGL